MSVQPQIDKLIAIRAAEWFEAIRSGETDVSSDEFRRWISESPRHVDAFMVVAGQAPLLREVLQAHPGGRSALGDPKQRGIVYLDPPTSNKSAERNAPPASPRAKPHRRRARAAAWISIAASVVIAALILQAIVPRGQRIATTTGEQRIVSLVDGSVVNLNAQSVIEVRMRERTREVRLLQGQAVFKVAHDSQRPFSVSTPTASVKAVGTEFAVSLRARDEQTVVTVLEGKVEVAPRIISAAPHQEPPTQRTPSSESETASIPRPGPRAFATAVAAGQAASVARSGVVQFDAHADIASSVAWLQRKLVFRRALLEDMVPEINRYNRAIQLHSDAVRPGVYRFNGTVDANDPLSLADLLSHEPGLVVEHHGTDIFIREIGRNP
jgi:transmembrane sensor